jgi:hypothetical protein
MAMSSRSWRTLGSALLWSGGWAVVVSGGVLLLGCGQDTTGQNQANPAAGQALPVSFEQLSRRGRPARWDAEQLRKRFAFQSVAGRLKYETERTADRKHRGRAAPLTKETAKRLEVLEQTLAAREKGDVRLRSLRLLHSDRVQEFIRREGNGVSRMVQPSPAYLELPAARPIGFAGVGYSSAEEESAAGVVLAGEGAAQARGNWPWPSADMLTVFHHNARLDFVNPSSFGVVKDRDHVAGFRPHQFWYLPELTDLRPVPRQAARPKERWVIGRLELVSLLKHDTPAVYVSDHLPRMQELKDNKTRPLDDFEQVGLKVLRSGEDLHAVAGTNRIRMVGALRAAKQCLDCHHGRRGDLLGAFSYDLRRVPPLAKQP